METQAEGQGHGHTHTHTDTHAQVSFSEAWYPVEGGGGEAGWPLCLLK